MPSLAQLWGWLGEVPDPEIPVISIVELGIVRAIAWDDSDPPRAIITLTPTYSGCPAVEVIARQVSEKLIACGVLAFELRTQLSPAWTTDWLMESAKESLRRYGIAPPMGSAGRGGGGLAAGLVVLGQRKPEQPPACPRCGSTSTEIISQFGSTPCKSLHRCLDCREPFDYFKCH